MADKTEILRQAGEEILNELRAQASELGENLEVAADEVAEFIAQKADELSFAVGLPGFNEALVAARDSVVLKAAGRAVVEGDRLDDTLRAIARSGLAIVARMLTML